MKKTLSIGFLLCVFSQVTFAQAIYGVFSLPPATNLGEKQIGNINPTSGDISLLGTNTSIEDGRIDMTTGATALNVTDNKSYFIGEDNSDDPLLVDRVYTVDLLTGITDASPVVTVGYSTSTNFGIWYDDIDDVLYGLFLIGGTTAELASIDPSTGVVTTVIADVVGEEVESLASGLMTGGRDNTNGSDAKRIFAFINNSLFAIDLDSVTSVLIEIGGASFLSSKTFGLEWDNLNNALWVLYNPDLGDRRIAQVLSEDDFTEEAFVAADFGLDGGANIVTASGLSALDEQSGLFFFIGRPSTGANTNKWSLYTVNLSDQTSINIDIEDAALVQTNGYAGIEVLPGPDITFSKTDGDVIDKTPGDSIIYTLNFSNDANAGATNGLTLTETVPTETTYNATQSTAGWVCDDIIAGSDCVFSPTDIPAGGSGTVDFAVTVDSIVSVALTSINNSATLSATNIVTDIIATDATPITAAAVLSVTKTDNDLLDAVPGDTIAYEITANNTGNRVASGVVLTETVPINTTYVATAPFVWNCNDVIAGSTCTTTATDLGDTGLNTTFHAQIISSLPAGTTEINNSVAMTADNATLAQASDNTPVTSAAVLTLAKTDGDTTITPGSTVVYQLNYANTGNQDADSAFITEVILAETQFDAVASSPSWVCLPDNMAGSSCTYDIGTLVGGTSASINFGLALNSPVPGIFSQLDNTAVIEATNATSVSAQDTTPVDASVALRIVKTDGEVTAALGKVVNYSLINFNEGDRNALQVELTETVPDNTTFYPPSSTAGWNCVPNNSAGSTCTFAVGSLDGLGGKNTTFFAVKVNDSLDSGVTALNNTASISAFNSIDTDSDTESTPVDQVIPSVTLVDANPSITEITSCSQNDAVINELVIAFSDDNPGMIGVDDVMNYALIDTGEDQDLQTASCTALAGDDQLVMLDDFSIGGTATNPIATLSLAESLDQGQYVLLVCDDITDAAGNALDGDMDGFTGGNLKRQFRIEFDNLFDNAYLDDCVDVPANLNDWMVISDNPEEVTISVDEDLDESSLSGSIQLKGLPSQEIGVQQCVNFAQPGSHLFSTSVLAAPGQVNNLLNLNMYMICSYSDTADCATQLPPNTFHFESFLLDPANDSVWNTYQTQLMLPDDAVSASCTMVMFDAFEGNYLYFADELSVTYDDIIFIDGFEID